MRRRHRYVAVIVNGEGGERLAVYSASPEYVLASTLRAGRPVDVDDAVPIAIVAGVTTLAGLLDLAAEAFPDPPRTLRLVYTTEAVAAPGEGRRQGDVDPRIAAGDGAEAGGLHVWPHHPAQAGPISDTAG